MKNMFWILLALFAMVLSGCAALENGANGRGDPTGKFSGQTGAVKPCGPLDREESELNQKLAGKEGANIQRQQDRISITLQCSILFDGNSNALTTEACRQLGEVADVLRKYPECRVKVDGFTDSSDREQYDHELTEARACAVRDVLVSTGINSSKIAARGFGDSKPVASNITDEGRQANRRVTITVSPQ